MRATKSGFGLAWTGWQRKVAEAKMEERGNVRYGETRGTYEKVSWRERRKEETEEATTKSKKGSQQEASRGKISEGRKAVRRCRGTELITKARTIGPFRYLYLILAH